VKLQATYSKNPDGSIKAVIKVVYRGDFPTDNIFRSASESPVDDRWNLSEGVESAITKTFPTSNEAKKWVSTQIEVLKAKLNRWRSMSLEERVTLHPPQRKIAMRLSSPVIVLLVILSIASVYVVISQKTKKGVQVATAPLGEKNEIEKPGLPKEKVTSTTVKKVESTTFHPWVVEIASFTSFNQAKTLSDQLKAKGHPAYVTGRTVRGQKWYRVRIGFYSTKKEVQEIKKGIASEFGIKDCWLHLLTKRRIKTTQDQF